MISTPSFFMNSRFGEVYNVESIFPSAQFEISIQFLISMIWDIVESVPENKDLWNSNPIWILISIIRVLHFVVDFDCVNWKKKKLVQNILYTHAFDFDTSNKNNNVIIIGPY